jgi:DNA repair protein RecO (recombination protein O)
VAAVHETDALVLRRVELGEADLIVALFTRELGRVSALARSARKSRKRFGGALEPFFTLRVRLEERARSELFLLSEASIVRPRLGLLSELVRLEVAGRALGWVRRAAPPRSPEPEAFQLLERLLDQLSTSEPNLAAESVLAELGLALLGAFGWGIDFERCVSCGRPCPEGTTSTVDASRGGLLCRNCGGGRTRLGAATRSRLARAAAREPHALAAEDVPIALDLIDRVFAAHAGID